MLSNPKGRLMHWVNCSQVGETGFGDAYLYRGRGRRRKSRLSVWSRRLCRGYTAKLSSLVSALRFFHAIPITLAPVRFAARTGVAARVIHERVFNRIKKIMQESKNQRCLSQRHDATAVAAARLWEINWQITGVALRRTFQTYHAQWFRTLISLDQWIAG